MYFINFFFVYSILGFICESIMTLFMNNGFKSGLLKGPYTPIYAFGGFIILFINKIIDKFKINKILKVILLFIFSSIILSLYEYMCGLLIEKILGMVYWDYSNQLFHIGKYTSVLMAFIWGTSSILFIYVIHPLCNKIILKVPNYISFILIIIFIIDFIFSIIKFS